MHVIQYLLSLTVLNGIMCDSCKFHDTCHDCMRDPSACVWCAANDYLEQYRCHSIEANLTNCIDHIENPMNEISVEQTQELSSVVGSVCQIKPKKYKLKIRPGQPLNFSFSFAAVQNPVDVYFLLDASQTMRPVKEAAVAQSKNIYETLHNYTNDVYLGLGTFVDKNAVPYNRDIYKHEAYSFKHELKLNADYAKFQDFMNNTKFGTNVDIPEGGLDALAQAIVCTKEIGWRKGSRKIIILLTDQLYHAAGDGRSAGIFQPYDGKCYTVNGSYMNELKMDYPSVNMINYLVKKHDITVIFAIADQVEDKYTSLNLAVTGSYKHILTDKEDNLVKILKDIYEKITKKIHLQINYISGQRNNFKLNFNPNCKKRINEACNVSTGKIFNFTGTITLPEYVNGLENSVLDIGIEGISEKLRLDVDIINDCECKKEAKNTMHCNDEIQECGVCKCSGLKYGLNCACIRNKNSTGDDKTACIMNGTTTDCHGRGKCTCGKCQCNPGFEGKYCECNLMSCPRDINGELCGGSKQGDCQCNKKCKCKNGWSGDVCECSDKVELCKRYSNDKICNDHGSCVCERCKCKDPEYWDSRTEQDRFCFLAPIPGSLESQCKLLTECVNCILVDKENCNTSCSYTNYIIVDALDTNKTDDSDEKLWKFCSDVRIHVGCYANFTYKFNTETYGIFLKVQKNYNCAQSYIIYGGILLGSLIAVGVATLVGWKVLTDWRDRREYDRFLKSEKVDVINENPFYKPATTKFTNPRFRK